MGCLPLVDGPFVETEYDAERDWVGSRNQKVWYLSERYAPGVEYVHGTKSMEVLISEKEIVVNGWSFDVGHSTLI